MKKKLQNNHVLSGLGTMPGLIGPISGQTHLRTERTQLRDELSPPRPDGALYCLRGTKSTLGAHQRYERVYSLEKRARPQA